MAYINTKRKGLIDDKQRAVLDSFVVRFIAACEEWARKNWVKNPSDPDGPLIRPTGEMKMQRVKLSIQDVAATDPVLKKVPHDQLMGERVETLIEAKLNLLRPQLSLPPGSAYAPSFSIVPSPSNHLQGLSKIPPPSSVAGLVALQEGSALERDTLTGKRSPEPK